MNLLTLSASYVRTQKLSTALNLLLLALGMATIVILMLFGDQLQQGLRRDARGIDLVVGAKGSPLQLVLSAVYHVDVPTGNIPLSEAQVWSENSLVKQAVPLSMGDSFGGFRIVGTTAAYPALYGARPASGRLWQAPMEATVGAEVAASKHLQIGDRIISVHGLSALSLDEHKNSPYTIVGILQPTGTVVDRLVLTSLGSIWQVHEHPDPDDHDEDTAMPHDVEHRQITALLLQYSTPLAAVGLPRQVNSQSALQAAAPAFEIARLMKFVGIGIDSLRLFGFLLIFTSGLGVFIALYNALEARQYDWAVMRSLGASRTWLFRHVLTEGLLLAFGGTLLGIFLGHATAEVIGRTLGASHHFPLTGLQWLPEELWLFALAAGVGVLAAVLPAARAYRTDIASTLARG